MVHHTDVTSHGIKADADGFVAAVEASRLKH